MEPPIAEQVEDAAPRSELEVFIHQPVCHFSLYDTNFLGCEVTDAVHAHLITFY